MTTVVAVLGSLATIIGGLVYVFKYSSWALSKTQDQADQDVEKQEQQNKHDAEDTGRPT